MIQGFFRLLFVRMTLIIKVLMSLDYYNTL
jgi:hypothetical protein